MFSRSLASLSISSTALSALNRAGFQTVDDLGSLSVEQLLRELDLPEVICEEITHAAKSTLPVLTQPAASLLDATRLSFSICKPIDVLIGNSGLKRGCVLELSGPPGSPKERAVIELVRSVLETDGEVLFLDTQNMILPSTMKSELKDIPGAFDRIHYIKCFSLPELMAFMYNLQSLLNEYPKTSLLVLNTLSFLFHTTPLTNSARGSLLEQIKTILSRVCASRHLSVAITVQLATKMVGMDGAAANFDTATKAVMAPQLGDSYLPLGRSYRLIFIPDSPRTGMIRLLSSPSQATRLSQTHILQEPYEMINGCLCALQE